MAKLTKVQKCLLRLNFVISCTAAFLSIVIGTLFSLLTDYSAEDNHFIIKASVWLLNIFISYSFSFLIFLPLYFKHKKTYPTLKFHYMNWFTLILTYTFSVIIVCIIGSILTTLM